MRSTRTPRSQQGLALLAFAAVFIVGFAWYAVGAINKIPRSSAREADTGIALKNAKQALLGYVAQYAAVNGNVPGQMPCPEPLNAVGSAGEGRAAETCSNVAAVLGRLPWKTLGLPEARDGYGELLWYAISPGFQSSPINFGTPAQLPLDSGTVVAMLLAPGPAMNTLADPATPPGGCTKVNQFDGRYTNPLNPAKFFECGNASGNYVTVGNSQWANDRAIAITAAEWKDAIAGAVAHRLQRQVAPALASWDDIEFAIRGKSWGRTHGISYLPFASTFTDPATNDYCGNAGATPSEGLSPVARNVAGPCSSDWSGNASLILGLVSQGCTQLGTGKLQCSFRRVFGTAPFSVRITATAQHAAESFRGFSIEVSNSGTFTLSTASMSRATGAATVVVNASWPLGVAINQTVTVTIDLPDAAVLSDTNVSWFIDNNWHRYTYYAVGAAATVSPTSACVLPGDPGCLTVNGLPASTGNASDKRLVLTLMGPPLATQTQPNSDSAQYLECHTAGTTLFTSMTVDKTYNDRLAVCPFKYTVAGGASMQVCN